jgi:DNA modification methylase
VTFIGSGSECVAAAELGRDYWGCEINEKYVEIASNRIQGMLI